MLQRFESFVSGISVCYKYIQRIKSMEMTEFGLKGTHVMCLFFLHRASDGLTASQLCALCNEDKAAVSRTLALLREKEYITGEGKTYRTCWRLTKQGVAITEQVCQLVDQWVAFGGEGVTEQERETFYKVLEHISNNLRKNYDEMSE